MIDFKALRPDIALFLQGFFREALYLDDEEQIVKLRECQDAGIVHLMKFGYPEPTRSQIYYWSKMGRDNGLIVYLKSGRAYQVKFICDPADKKQLSRFVNKKITTREKKIKVSAPITVVNDDPIGKDRFSLLWQAFKRGELEVQFLPVNGKKKVKLSKVIKVTDFEDEE